MNKILTSFILICTLIFVGGAPLSFAYADTSSNWAGYVAEDGTYTGVGGTWIVPTATEGTGGLTAHAVWVGIGGTASRDLIQTGTQALVEGGSVVYYAWYEMLPAYQHHIPIMIHPGDSVSASLRETSKNIWHLSFRNNTTGALYETNLSYDSSETSAEWIVEKPLLIAGDGTSLSRLNSFDSVTFKNAYAIRGGSLVDLAHLDAQPVTLANRGKTLASATDLKSDGSFTVSQPSSSSADQVPRATQVFSRARRAGHSYLVTITFSGGTQRIVFTI